MSNASIAVAGQLADAEVAAVRQLIGRAAAADGVEPLSEHVMLHLTYGGDPAASNLLLRQSDGKLAGYAHLDPTDPVAGPSGELVICPAHRRHGHGLALVRALAGQAEKVSHPGSPPLRLWAHGDLPAATALAAAAGFERVRALWQMSRPLREPIREPEFPAGVSLRTFEGGRDEQAWTDLNARAFVRHPEQGAWTRRDLELREREPWFDPAGFFLAQREDRLVGFHWTKVHGEEAGASPHQHEAIGEVYVVGVDPGERGTGLGRALTLTGLRYLRSRGLRQAMLYVDEENVAAIGLYRSLGFAHTGTDVMFGSKQH